MFDLNTPMILLTREREQCQARYDTLKHREPYKVAIAKKAWRMLEDADIALGPHVGDIPWLHVDELHASIFPRVTPLDLLMDVMQVPPHVPRDEADGSYSRASIEAGVLGLIRETQDESLRRSVAIGWISLAVDHALKQHAA